jgi:predicted transposase YdaD
MSFDNVCKLLAEKYPADFVRWLINDEARNIKILKTEILAGLRFEKSLIRQLLSEDIMQESVIYQDILQKGEQKEAFRFLNRQLNRKFSSIDPSIVNRIQVLSTEELELLGEEFLGFSDVSELVAWLDRSTGS